jgi:hypothetical protein
MERERLEKLLIEARVLRASMPNNYTYNKVREILTDLEKAEEGALKEALTPLAAYGIKSPLGAVTFLKRDLGGRHKVGVDRVTMTEQGEELAVSDYPEGGLPIPVKNLPRGLGEGVRLRYDPASGRYTKV